MATVTLYHGSKDQLTEILAETGGYVCFGGVFASQNKANAASFGDCIHTIEIDDQEIGNTQDLWYTYDNVPAERRAMIKAIKAMTTAKTKAQVEAVFEIVADDKDPSEDMFSVFRAADFAEASWKAQALRGAIAKAAGFRAIEMSDEFGTSYLVLGGINTKIEMI